ncbi:MAG: histidine kinase [Chloroflexi bacterium]|nr:histidine kinase [Chloroflexota bacterium]
MTWQLSPIALMYLLSAMINLFTALINWRRRHGHKGISILSVVIFVIGLWLTGSFLEMAVVEISNKFIFLAFEDSISGFAFILLFFFALDYFTLWPWFRGWWRGALWLTGVANALIGWTNSAHHWFWTGFTFGPPASNVIYYTHGPLWAIGNVFFIGLVALSLILMCYKSIISRGQDQQTALFVAAALAAPFITYFISVLLPDQLIGLLATPFGYAITALLIDWAAVEDFRYQVNQQTNGLVYSIEKYKQEIDKREKLELELRKSQDILAMRLASQSSKMTGVYDLILVSGQASKPQDLLEASLSKILTVINCQTTLFLELNPNQELHIVASQGIDLDHDLTDLAFSSDWLPIAPDVCADISSHRIAGLPPELRLKGYEAALLKWVIVQDHPMGILAVYWKTEYSFAVEDIALFGALSDGLGLIMENARLRQIGADEATRQERRRLARDLHDSVTQSLHSLVLSSQSAMEETRDPERLKRILKGLDTGARQALKEMRLLLYELRLASPINSGLVELLSNRLDAVEHRAGIHAEIIVDPTASWPKEWELELYPLAMEALNNSLKHARASYVSVRLHGAHDHLQMEIQDNGLGFDLAAVPPGGMGMKNMAERCERLGAYFSIITSPSAGTTIQIKLKNSEEDSLTKATNG